MRYRYRKSKKHEMMLKISLKMEGETGPVWEEGCCGGHLAAQNRDIIRALGGMAVFDAQKVAVATETAETATMTGRGNGKRGDT